MEHHDGHAAQLAHELGDPDVQGVGGGVDGGADVAAGVVDVADVDDGEGLGGLGLGGGRIRSLGGRRRRGGEGGAEEGGKAGGEDAGDGGGECGGHGGVGVWLGFLIWGLEYRGLRKGAKTRLGVIL